MKQTLALLLVVLFAVFSPPVRATGPSGYEWYVGSSDLMWNTVGDREWTCAPDITPLDWAVHVYGSGQCAGTRNYSKMADLSRGQSVYIGEPCNTGSNGYKKVFVVFDNYGYWSPWIPQGYPMTHAGFYCVTWDFRYNCWRVFLFDPPAGTTWAVYMLKFTRYADGGVNLDATLVDESYSVLAGPTSVYAYEGSYGQ